MFAFGHYRRETMGSRVTGEGAAGVYEAAEQWVNRALKTDDSLFTPNNPIWSSRWLGELRDRYLNQPDDSEDNFYTKMERQLAGSPAEVYQLMAEVLYVHFLIVWRKSIGASKKESQIRQVLGWSNRQIPVPEDLVASLNPGISAVPPAFFQYRPFQVGFLIAFAERWKRQTIQHRTELLGDPWAFKQFLHFEPSGKLFDESSGDKTYRTQRTAVLHLVFPDTFDKILAITHKEAIIRALAELVTDPDQDPDRQLAQIRRGLEAQTGRNFNTYYEADIFAKWNRRLRTLWDRFVLKARAFIDTGRLDSQENHYKIEIGKKLGVARGAVLAGIDGWTDLVKSGLTENLIYPVTLAKLREWVDQSPDVALPALQELWKPGDSSISERIRAFTKRFPKSAIDSGGAGTRMNVVSQFLMGLDVESYPPFRITLFDKAYDQTGYTKPAKDADEAALYEHALRFLDLFIQESARRGLTLRHRLDAQSVMWAILQNGPINNGPETRPPGPNLMELSQELLLPEYFLEEIDILLKEKKQVIFQGPPGTGKTYVAQQLARCLAGSEERVTLVQFHPSYAYEDFVQGFRPTLTGGGQAGFKLTDGPLLTAARKAREETDQDHFLVIDEINRGNLAKILGELYFLLEYRDQQVTLQYGDASFSLPKNLYIIGTMNTADRSIALVDLALRRRFYFVDFHPDDEPIKGLLRQWLTKNAPGMEWVADVVERANQKLAEDRHVAIGPSYFMGTDEEGKAVVVDETTVSRIWRHSVLPYIEEHRFGSPDGLGEWRLEKLHKNTKTAGPKEDKPESETDQATDASG
ncbi:MAG: AAA family ATPase [bacterium]|nr:AAA family ATPase [Acidimicrobiia bacterium]MCY4649812.1 AAA family ATPase [bacterium]